MRKLKLWFICVVGLSFIFVLNSPAYAISLSYETVSDALGTKYNFTLTNDDVDPNVFELFIHAPTDVSNLLSFDSPVGWGDGFGGSIPYYGPDTEPGTSFVEWFADPGKELSKGNVLRDFYFTSSSQVTSPILFSYNQRDDVFFTARNNYDVPVVPEPVSSVLLTVGALAMAGFKRWKK